ncbi:MAG: AFG1 family ATPase [Alphaproteobacteria bacterium]|nr:AFG1 family ATPase [Alphaproteobacteria bacterium]
MKTNSPLTRYRQQCESGVLTPDPDQARAVAALERVYTALAAHPVFPLQSFMQRLAGGFIVPRGRGNREKPPEIKGLYLYGGVGRGKSMVMDLFFDSLPETVPARRVHFHEFLIELHEGLHKRRGEGVDAILPDFAKDIAARVRVLCFDEFHVTDVADAMILGRLFTALFAQGVVVVATSNWPPDRLYEGGLQRELFLPFIALLKEKTEVICMDGPRDYRLQTLQEDGVYFWPLGRPARQKADKTFADLTENTKPYKETLSVRGRNLTVRRSAKGVARFSFAELCERPMGAEDYLHIAQSYHTVFLEGIPKLGYDRRNETKRLMTLIDVLYEKGTKLVVTAAAPPGKLYVGPDYAFEFQRTVSRLTEMQSVDYMKT